MRQQELLTKCPLCSGEHFNNVIQSKDFTVTGEDFNIVSCETCGFKFTNPRPLAADMGHYYESKDYVSHTNQANSIINTIYKIARKFTLGWKYNLIKKQEGAKTILDYGCGTGEFINFCKNKGWQIQGIEPNSKARQQATNLNNQGIKSSLSQIDNAAFQVITMWHVLEHIPDLKETFTALKKMLTPDGFMLIAVPNCNSHDAQLFKEDWAAYDLPRHLYHFTQKSMQKMMTNHGMDVVTVIPMKLDAYYVSLLSNKIKFGRNKLLKSFVNGLYSNSYANKHNEYSSLIYLVKHHNA